MASGQHSLMHPIPQQGSGHCQTKNSKVCWNTLAMGPWYQICPPTLLFPSTELRRVLPTFTSRTHPFPEHFHLEIQTDILSANGITMKTCRPRNKFAPHAGGSAPIMCWSYTEVRRQTHFPPFQVLGGISTLPPSTDTQAHDDHATRYTVLPHALDSPGESLRHSPQCPQHSGRHLTSTEESLLFWY